MVTVRPDRIEHRLTVGVIVGIAAGIVLWLAIVGILVVIGV